MTPAPPTTGGDAAIANQEAERGWPQGLVMLLLVAALIRIPGLAGPGHGGDLYAFLEWAAGVATHGLGGYYAAGGDSNYPPMLYLLYPLGLTLSGKDLEFAIRAMSIPFDLVLAALLFFIIRSASPGSAQLRERVGLLGAASYVLNPAVILTGPAWGQVDGMGALPMVAALVAAARGRAISAGALAVIAGLIKPQFGVAAIVLAGLTVFWLRSPNGPRQVMMAGLAGAVTFVAVLLPLGLGPTEYLDLMRETFGRYPVHSGLAFNPWGMVFGFNHADGQWFTVGTAAELLAIAGSLWLLRARRDLVGLLAVGSLIALTLYFVPTRAHERYLYGAIALLAPLAALAPTLRVPFAALSTMFFITLAYVIANSPYRILPGPQLETFPDWAISVMAALLTACGLWVALRLVELLWTPVPNGPAGTTHPAQAAGAGSG
jgi:hypothetical protein